MRSLAGVAIPLLALIASSGCCQPSDDPCTPGCQPDPDQTRTVMVGGMERSFRVHIPDGYDFTPTPVVFNFHATFMTAEEQEMISRMSDKADEAGFIVVYPQGFGALTGWNAGVCCGTAMIMDVDDVGFTDAMVDDLSGDLCVDDRRIHATGLSNGGFLAYRLACERADRIASVGVVSASIGVDPCTPGRPFSVTHIHGTDDPQLPWEGIPAQMFPSVDETIDGWVTRNNCDPTASEFFRNGAAHCDAYPGCDAGEEVTLCTIDGGGHAWPGGEPFPKSTHGVSSNDIIANDHLWDFFEAHPLP